MDAMIERFARAMFDVWPLRAVSSAMAEESGQEVGSALTYDKVLEMGGNHDGLLRLAKGAAALHVKLEREARPTADLGEDGLAKLLLAAALANTRAGPDETLRCDVTEALAAKAPRCSVEECMTDYGRIGVADRATREPSQSALSRPDGRVSHCALAACDASAAMVFSFMVAGSVMFAMSRSTQAPQWLDEIVLYGSPLSIVVLIVSGMIARRP